MSNQKTHYRKVFKSDHLGSADLEEFTEEGKELIFTIKHVKQEIGARVAGRKIDANIAYFHEPIKPMVLNAGNSKIVSSLSGGSPFVEDWKDVTVELYVNTSVKFGSEVVSGIRIKPDPPKVLDKNQIKVVIDQVAKVTSIADLTTLYNSDIKFRTNKEIVAAISKRGAELKVETK